jgi:cellulose biosynthesis protein BcsQ
MKSTIAAAVGVTLVEAGFSVLAVDLDPEHRDRGASLATWLDERRERHPLRTQVAVERPETAREALDMISSTTAEIVLIDCPSRATEASALIAAGCDFTVLPLVPGEKDARLTTWTLDMLTEAGIEPSKLAVMLTRTGSDSEAADYKRLIASQDFGGAPINLVAAHIPERIAYRNALTRRLVITEAQPLSVGRAARRAIDSLIEAYMCASDAGSDTSTITRNLGAAR